MTSALVLTRKGNRDVLTLPAGPCADCEARLKETTDSRDRAIKVLFATCHDHALTQRIDAPGMMVTLRLPWWTAPGPEHVPMSETVRGGHMNPERVLTKIREVLDSLARWDVADVNDEAAMLRAMDWALAGQTPAVMNRWIGAGVQTVREMRGWAARGFAERPARAWIAAGVTSPEDAHAWRSVGAGPKHAVEFARVEHYQFVSNTALPKTGDWGALHEHVNVAFALAGRRAGATPAQVRRLGHALTRDLPAELPILLERNKHTMAWSYSREHRLLEAVEGFTATEWAEVGWCLLAGMDMDAARAFVASGEDMEPVRLLGGLAA